MVPLQQLYSEGVIPQSAQTGDDWERISVKMNIDSDATGRNYDKETVRRARQRIQNHFAKKLPFHFQLTRFQFNSPKDDREHAAWLTVGRVYYGADTYKQRITAVRQAFEELKTDFCG